MFNRSNLECKRGSMKNQGCVWAIVGVAGLTLLSAAQKNPWMWAIIAVLVVLGVWLVNFQSGKKSESDRESHLRNIELLETLAQNLTAEKDSGLALRKGEVVVYRLGAVGLVEFRSNGSSYSGGSQGFSMRIMKGVSYRVGANRGSLTKNPETLQMVDQGSATFTNQRVVFSGASTSREWDFSKFLDTNVTANGVTAYMAVSNRQKTSGLTWVDKTDLTPGLVFAVANDYFEGGPELAAKKCYEIANEIRTMLKLAPAVALKAPEVANPDPRPTRTATAHVTLGPRFDLVGESFYRANFDKIRTAHEFEVGQTHTTIATLVAEPDNRYSQNGKAVSVQIGGLVVGHIPEASNSNFFDLLIANGGTATCEAELYLDPDADEKLAKNSVRLLVAMPPVVSF